MSHRIDLRLDDEPQQTTWLWCLFLTNAIQQHWDHETHSLTTQWMVILYCNYTISDSIIIVIIIMADNWEGKVKFKCNLWFMCRCSSALFSIEHHYYHLSGGRGPFWSLSRVSMGAAWSSDGAGGGSMHTLHTTTAGQADDDEVDSIGWTQCTISYYY